MSLGFEISDFRTGGLKMSLSTPYPSKLTTIQQDANRLRELAAATSGHGVLVLQKVRNIVSNHGRTALAAELGNDAGQLQNWFNGLKTMVEAATGMSEQDLPD
jgi:hypothetical protein